MAEEFKTCPNCGSRVWHITRTPLDDLLGIDARLKQIERELSLLLNDLEETLQLLKADADKLKFPATPPKAQEKGNRK